MKYQVLIGSIALFSFACFSVTTANGQFKKKKKKDKAEATATKEDFKTLESGLAYWIVKDAPGGKTPGTGDYVEVNLRSYVGDSLLIDSRAMNNNMPVQFQVAEPSFKGDLVEGIRLMTAGDSAIFKIPVDSVEKAGVPVQPWMKENAGAMMRYEVSVVSVKTKEELQQEQQALSKKQMEIDDKILQDYFTKNKIQPKKTASGLYYVMKKEGDGPAAEKGKKVTVNYTGKFLDGEAFDSNVDPKFQHVQPFTFVLGQGQVIRGWDEGVALLKKGGEATLYIPSPLAYGANAQGPIKANSILMFDVEVTDVE